MRQPWPNQALQATCRPGIVSEVMIVRPHAPQLGRWRVPPVCVALDDPLLKYAEYWLQRRSLYGLNQPRFIGFNARWIREAEEGRPGFSTSLRHVALQALDSPDSLMVSQGVSALAVVGLPDDLPRLMELMESGGPVAKDARTAAWEIEHRRG